MKIKAKYILCVALAVMLIILPSCSMFWASNSTYSGGQILDDELMSSMRAEIIGEKAEATKSDETNRDTSDVTIKDEADGTVNGETESNESDSFEIEDSIKKDEEEPDNTVYWTKGGGVYHLYKDCGYIKSSSEILSGTVEEALEAKKSGVCSRCQNRKDKE